MPSRPQLNLRQSVGLGAVNDPADVRAVQAALSVVVPGGDLRPDGVCGPDTIAAIQAYQATFLRASDGRCEPGDRTFRRLRSDLADAPPAVRAAEWDGDPEAWSEEKKLASLHPTFRAGVSAMLAELRGDGFAPTLTCGWRAGGPGFGFQNAQLPEGTPNAWAAELGDAGHAGFPEALGAAAQRQGYGVAEGRVQGLGNRELRRIRRESGLG